MRMAAQCTLTKSRDQWNAPWAKRIAAAPKVIAYNENTASHRMACKKRNVEDIFWRVCTKATSTWNRVNGTDINRQARKTASSRVAHRHAQSR
jgi:hypothetical protein